MSYQVVRSEGHLSRKPAANRLVRRSAAPLIGLTALQQGLDGEIPSFYLNRATSRPAGSAVLGDTETAPSEAFGRMRRDLTIGESGRRPVWGVVRTAQGVPGRVQPVLDVWAGEAVR